MDADKKLYDEDLMLNDLVLMRETAGNEDVYPFKPGRVHMRHLKGIAEGYIEAKAIPLTEEILEKNSFKKENGEYWNIGKNQYGNTMYLNEVSYGYIVCTKCFDSDEYVYLYDCKYVHELQHYFKDCKIEKNIIL